MVLFGQAPAGSDLIRRSFARRWRGLLRREISTEVIDVGIAQVRCERRHLRVLAPALAEHDELCRDELLGLAGERRNGGIGGIFLRSLGGFAGLRLFPL